MEVKLDYPQPPDYTAFSGPNAGSIEPPKIPTGPISVFGEPQSFEEPETVMPPDTPILYDESGSPLVELKKINHQILFAFQKLVGIIANGLESPDECLERIKHLFFNAHDLLHKLRKVQGFEHMHHALRQKNKELEDFKRKFDKHLEDIASLKPP